MNHEADNGEPCTMMEERAFTIPSPTIPALKLAYPVFCAITAGPIAIELPAPYRSGKNIELRA